MAKYHSRTIDHDARALMVKALPIQEAPGYFVTPAGEVISTRPDYLMGINPRRLAWSPSVLGYARVTLCCNGKRWTRLVHRLVAQAFIPNPDNKPCVNHKDGDKLNNHVENLEWATALENVAHAASMGLICGPDCVVNRAATLSERDTYAIRCLSRNGVDSAVISKAFKVSQRVVEAAIDIKQWEAA